MGSMLAPFVFLQPPARAVQTPESPRLNGLVRVEVSIGTGEVRSNPCPVTQAGTYDGCTGMAENFFKADRSNCEGTAVFSDGSRIVDSCAFGRLNADGSVDETLGGGGTEALADDGSVNGCLSFTYRLPGADSNLVFVDPADNVWLIAGGTIQQPSLQWAASGYDASRMTWDVNVMTMKGTAHSGTVTKTINISLSGRATASLQCLALGVGPSISEFSVFLSGSGTVS